MAKEETSRLSTLEIITLLAKRRKNNDWVYCISPEGLRYLNVRYHKFSDPEKPFQLMFKRCTELKKYYPKIRQWFDDNELDWKDIVRNDEKYMMTACAPSPARIEALIVSAQNDIFGFSETYINSSDSDLSIKFHGMRFPIMGIMSIGVLFLSFVGYILYQMYNLPDLGKPSLKALDRAEVFLLLAFPLGILGAHVSGLWPRTKKEKKTPKWKRPEVIAARLFQIFLVFLGMCTY